MNWLKAICLFLASFLFASCDYNELKKNFDEAEGLAREAVTSRDSLQLIADSLQGVINSQNSEIMSFDMSYAKLYQMLEPLRLENDRLREVEKKFTKNKEKSKTKVSVGVASVKKENTEVSRPDTSITVTVSDSLDTDNTKEPVKPMSFIEYVWSKRNKVEP